MGFLPFALAFAEAFPPLLATFVRSSFDIAAKPFGFFAPLLDFGMRCSDSAAEQKDFVLPACLNPSEAANPQREFSLSLSPLEQSSQRFLGASRVSSFDGSIRFCLAYSLSPSEKEQNLFETFRIMALL